MKLRDVIAQLQKLENDFGNIDTNIHTIGKKLGTKVNPYGFPLEGEPEVVVSLTDLRRL